MFLVTNDNPFEYFIVLVCLSFWPSRMNKSGVFVLSFVYWTREIGDWNTHFKYYIQRFTRYLYKNKGTPVVRNYFPHNKFYNTPKSTNFDPSHERPSMERCRLVVVPYPTWRRNDFQRCLMRKTVVSINISTISMLNSCRWTNISVAFFFFLHNNGFN